MLQTTSIHQPRTTQTNPNRAPHQSPPRRKQTLHPAHRYPTTSPTNITQPKAGM
jgi:hypothetical protein